MVIQTSSHFEREIKKLSNDLKELTKKKLKLLLEHPSHPSLRIKKIQGYHEIPPIFELSVNMAIRITFQKFPDLVYLRHIGSHQILKNP